MMWVSAGKMCGRDCLEKVRWDWVYRTCCRVAGEDMFGEFGLREGTEGEEGSFSSRCGWFEIHVLPLQTPGYPMFFVSIGPNSGQQRENGANQKIRQT